MTDPLEMAKELGRAIAGSVEYQGLLTCEKGFSDDKNALTLLKSFERERQKVQNLQTLGLEVPPSAFDELESLQDKIRENDSIRKLMDFQKAYETLLRKVNEEINKQIDVITRSVLPYPTPAPAEEEKKE